MRALVLSFSLFLTGCLSYVDKDLPHIVSFQNTPCVKPHDSYRYTTCDDMHVYIDDVPFRVPAGFDTDFASIPQLFWFHVAPFKANLVAASILHDYMYACPDKLTRRYADDVFYSALISEGVNGNDALKFYYAVRFAGESFFHANNRCDEEGS
jgi:hypothetical protein